VGAENFAGIITPVVTIFGERKFRRTLENFDKHCNYLLYYGSSILKFQYFRIPPLQILENILIRIPGLYIWAVGIKERFSDDKIQK
jgi:hypothetical protein